MSTFKRSFKHTFDLSPNTTVDGLIQEFDVFPTHKAYRLIELGRCSDGRSLDGSGVLHDDYLELRAMEWNLALAFRGRTVDLLDMTTVSLPAYDRWNALCEKTIRDMIDSGAIRSLSDAANIPHEQLEVLPSGELRFFVAFQGRTIDMKVAPTEWQWRD